MRKNTIPVSGMHCKACEVLLEKTIRNLDGVEKVSASQSKGSVEVSYDKEIPNWKAVESIITENGYSLGNKKDLPWIQTDPSEYETLVVSAFVLGTLYYLSKFFGFGFGGVGDISAPTVSVAFLIGLTAGVSSCMALVGGLVLGISAKWNENHANQGGWSRFKPHVLFNLGRVLGFWFFGGLLGAFGAFIGFSNVFIGFVTLSVGALMLLLGLNLTGLSPRLGDVSVTLPKFLGKNLGSDASGPIGTMTTGALTFFLPCGFTLAMQVYAVSTGSFMTGALTLAFFALGTAPGLLGVGGLTSFFKGEAAKAFFKFTGVVVLALAVFNISNGYALLSLGSTKSVPTANVDASKLEVQEVRMAEDGGGYSPTVIKIKPNARIRLTIDAKAVFSCASQFTIPSLGIQKNLKSGENVIEFVSPASGTVKFSCSMGMYTGEFVVEGEPGASVGSVTTASADSNAGTANSGNSGRGMAGCSMMGGSRTVATANAANAVTVNAAATITGPSEARPATGTSETIDLIYDATNGLSKENVLVKSGKDYVIRIKVEDTIQGCMHRIVIPGIDENEQELNAWTTVVFNVKNAKPGKYAITCAMGVPHGYLVVE